MWEERGERGRKGEAKEGDWPSDLGKLSQGRGLHPPCWVPRSVLTSLITFNIPVGEKKKTLQLSLYLGGTLAWSSTPFWLATFSDSLRKTWYSVGVCCRGPVGVFEGAGCTELVGCLAKGALASLEFVVGPGCARLARRLRPCRAAASPHLATSVETQPLPRRHPALATQG